jgi:hypothetical protein
LAEIPWAIKEQFQNKVCPKNSNAYNHSKSQRLIFVKHFSTGISHTLMKNEQH